MAGRNKSRTYAASAKSQTPCAWHTCAHSGLTLPARKLTFRWPECHQGLSYKQQNRHRNPDLAGSRVCLPALSRPGMWHFVTHRAAGFTVQVLTAEQGGRLPLHGTSPHTAPAPRPAPTQTGQDQRQRSRRLHLSLFPLRPLTAIPSTNIEC